MTGIEVRGGVEPGRVPQLMDLFAGEWWTAGRTVRDVEKMLAASDLVFAAVLAPADRLVGFARVLTDRAYLAVVLDVIVAADLRGRGVARMLLAAVVSHPDVAGVRSVELVCQPDLIPFYRRWGFTERVGRSLLMRRTMDRRLANLAGES
jgi:GNAT superfamily N-acetyltransferase